MRIAIRQKKPISFVINGCKPPDRVKRKLALNLMRAIAAIAADVLDAFGRWKVFL
jgi:hypothetical protein